MSDIQIYVGTYAKYNSGSIAGAWIDLEGMDKDDFYEKCAELHADESDPEFMFQDFEGFPKDMCSESGLDDDAWEWLQLDESDRDMVAAHRENCGAGNSAEFIREAFLGTAGSELDYTHQYCDEIGLLDSVPEDLRYYFDYERYSRDLFNNDFFSVEYNDTFYIFRNA